MTRKYREIRQWRRQHFTKGGFLCDCGCGVTLSYAHYTRKVFIYTSELKSREELVVHRLCET